MFYHNEINTVMYQWRNKYICKKEALRLLGEIEDRAYERIPNAEPDGDITYAVATAVEEILGV
jgi:hypothetical protein